MSLYRRNPFAAYFRDNGDLRDLRDDREQRTTLHELGWGEAYVAGVQRDLSLWLEIIKGAGASLIA